MSDAGVFAARVLNLHQRRSQEATGRHVPGTYLVIIRETRLAHAVAMELRARLLRRGHRSRALVPPLRGRDFTALAYRYLAARWSEQHLAAGERPVLVALCEKGLTEDLGRLGLTAYISVPPEEKAAELRGSNGTCSIIVPAATARQFVAAVIDHSLPEAAPSRSAVGYRPSSLPRAVARSSRPGGWTAIGAAGVAGTLVVAGMAPSDLGHPAVALTAYQETVPRRLPLAADLLPALQPAGSPAPAPPPGNRRGDQSPAPVLPPPHGGPPPVTGPHGGGPHTGPAGGPVAPDPYEIGRNVGINLLGDVGGLAAYYWAVKKWPDNEAKQIAFGFLAGNLFGLTGWASGPFLQEAAQGHIGKAMDLVSHQFQQMAADVNQFSLNQLGEYLTGLGFNPAVGHFWVATIVGNALGIPAGMAGQWVYGKLQQKLDSTVDPEQRGKAARIFMSALKIASPTAFENLVSYATRSYASSIPTPAAAAALVGLVSNLTWKMLPPDVQKNVRDSVSKAVGAYWATHPFKPYTPGYLGPGIVGLPPTTRLEKGGGPITGSGPLAGSGPLEGGRLVAPKVPGLQQAKTDPPSSDPGSLFQPGVQPEQPFGLPDPLNPAAQQMPNDSVTPAIGDQPAPVSGDQPAPVSGDQPAPVNGDQAAPVNGDQAAPVIGDQPAPVIGDQPAPINGDQPAAVPVNQDGAAPVIDPNTSSDTGNINDEATNQPVQLPPTLPAVDTAPPASTPAPSFSDQLGSDIEKAWTSVSGDVGDFFQNQLHPTPSELPWEGPPTRLLTGVLDESYNTPLTGDSTTQPATTPDQAPAPDTGNVNDQAVDPSADQAPSPDAGNVNDQAVDPSADQAPSPDAGNVNDQAVDPSADQAPSPDAGNVNDQAADPSADQAPAPDTGNVNDQAADPSADQAPAPDTGNVNDQAADPSASQSDDSGDGGS